MWDLEESLHERLHCSRVPDVWTHELDHVVVDTRSRVLKCITGRPVWVIVYIKEKQ